MAAGGEPAHLVLTGGRDLKQRRIGLFWSLLAFHQPARIPKRLVLHCQVCGRELSQPIHGSTVWSECWLLPRLHRASWFNRSYPAPFFGRSVAGPFGRVL